MDAIIARIRREPVFLLALLGIAYQVVMAYIGNPEQGVPFALAIAALARQLAVPASEVEHYDVAEDEDPELEPEEAGYGPYAPYWPTQDS